MSPNSAACNRALVPLLRWRIGVARRARARLPLPFDAPEAHANAFGQSADRVLVFGTGPAVGWGVATHSFALPGYFARALTKRTRRGTDVDVVAAPYLCAKDAGSMLTERDLSRYDATIIVLGVDDALQFTPVAEWRRAMSALVSAAVEASPGHMSIIVTGIRPIRSMSMFDSFVGGFADRHASVLNRETAALYAAHERVTYVPLEADLMTVSSEGRTPKGYASWAAVLSDTLAPLLATRIEAEERRPGDLVAIVAGEIRQPAVDAPVPIHTESPPQSELQRHVSGIRPSLNEPDRLAPVAEAA